MKVVFVCTGNTCRSPMAEHMLRHRLEEKGDSTIQVESAGVSASRGQPAARQTLAVLDEAGISSIHEHQSKPVEDVELAEGDLVLTMSRGHLHRLTDVPDGVETDTLKDFAGEGGSISDPFGGDLSVYRDLYEELDPLIRTIVKKIAN